MVSPHGESLSDVSSRKRMSASRKLCRPSYSRNVAFQFPIDSEMRLGSLHGFDVCVLWSVVKELPKRDRTARLGQQLLPVSLSTMCCMVLML